MYNARAIAITLLINLLFGGVLVAVAVVVWLSSLIVRIGHVSTRKLGDRQDFGCKTRLTLSNDIDKPFHGKSTQTLLVKVVLRGKITTPSVMTGQSRCEGNEL